MRKIICDVCKKNETHQQYFFETHNSFNGVDRDSEGKYYDLCDSCYLRVLMAYMRGLKENYSRKCERNKKLIQLIKKEIKNEN